MTCCFAWDRIIGTGYINLGIVLVRLNFMHLFFYRKKVLSVKIKDAESNDRHSRLGVNVAIAISAFLFFDIGVEIDYIQ